MSIQDGSHHMHPSVVELPISDFGSFKMDIQESSAFVLLIAEHDHGSGPSHMIFKQAFRVMQSTYDWLGLDRLWVDVVYQAGQSVS